MYKLALVAILLAVCVSISESQPMVAVPAIKGMQKASGYFLPANQNYDIALLEVVGGLLDPVTDLLQCVNLLSLLNANETALLASLQAAIAVHADLINQNTNWCGCSDSNARVLDKLQLKADTDITLGAVIGAREINRGFLYAKTVASAKAEAEITLLADKYRAVVEFRAYVKGLLGALLYNTLNIGGLADCLGITVATLDMQTKGLGLPIVQLLLDVKARATVITGLVPKLTPELFAAVYTRKPALAIGANALAAISADLVADARLHLFAKLNRKVNTWLELVECFGNDTNVISGSVRFNVIKRLFDLLDDAFDRNLEVDLIELVNIVTNATAGHIDFNVKVRVVAAANINVVGAKLVTFLRGFITAFSFPGSIDVITSAKVGATTSWNVVVRVKAAVVAAIGFDPRNLVLDLIPQLNVNPDNTPDDKNNSDYKDCIENPKYDVPPASAPAAAAEVEATLVAAVDVIAKAKADLKAKLDAYIALPSFDFTKIDAQIKDYTTATFDLVNLRAKAAVAAVEVKAAHLQLIGKVKADLADQLIVAKNCDILAINLKLQLIASIAALNGTNRTGCNQTIPNWKADDFDSDDCYALAKFPACQAVAQVLAQLHLIKSQLLTSTSVKASVAAKVEVLTAKVAELEVSFKAYANAIVTTGFAVKATADALVKVVAQTDFNLRVNACVKTVTNGILATSTYVSTKVGVGLTNILSHTINAQFKANLGLSTAVLNDRLNGALQLCLSMHIGGDLSYFKDVPKSTISAASGKRALEQGGSSNVQTDFGNSDGTTTETVSTSQTTSQTSSQQVSTTSASGVFTFSFIAFAVMIVALLL